MSSTKYPCYDSVHIPGVPGTFAGVIVEIDDATCEVLAVTTFDGQPVPDPAQQPSPEEDNASSDIPESKEK